MSLLQLLSKKLYYRILLTILLYVSIDISSYNYIVLGKEDDSDDETVREKETEDDDDYRDNDVREDKEEEEDEKEEEDKVPFILPFKAVPFP
jgi:hypothetical protein